MPLHTFIWRGVRSVYLYNSVGFVVRQTLYSRVVTLKHLESSEVLIARRRDELFSCVTCMDGRLRSVPECIQHSASHYDVVVLTQPLSRGGGGGHRR